MAKPIMLTAELIEQMTQEFKEKLGKLRLSDGKVDYTRAFKYQNKDKVSARIQIEPTAYIKMMALVDQFTTEVGWHGVVRRDSDIQFTLTDIMVYPQTVTGSTVNTDDEKYAKWLMTIENETFNAMHFHGHSHVNFATTPSEVDDAHREKLLAQIGPEDFYIFMIWNKRGEHNARIYDLKNNVLYENEDIEVCLNTENFDMDAFLKAAQDKVKTKYASYNYSTGASSGITAVTTPSAKGTSKKSTKKKEEKPLTRYPSYYGGAAYDDGVDYDDYVFGRGRVY